MDAKHKTSLALAGLVMIFLFVGLYFSFQKSEVVEPVNSPETPEVVGISEQDNLIKVSYPKPDEKVSSPLVIRGEARGNYFFEASFPVVLTNWDGLIIAEGIAQAQGEWMTEDFVPFVANLEFTKPDYGERGFLILKKDNPSGLPEHDFAIEIPIYFK
mgnify:CR=1 FL=1